MSQDKIICNKADLISVADTIRSKLGVTDTYHVSELSDAIDRIPTGMQSWYGTCSTASSTAAKTVDCTGFTLETGARIAVRFSNTNTASSPTLNVNSTGAKSIYYRNAAITASVLAANRIYEFVYDGSQYELVGDINVVSSVNGTTTPSRAIYAPTSSGSSGQYLKSSGSNTAPTWASAPTPDYYPIYTHFGTGLTLKGLGDLTSAGTTIGYKFRITSITGTQPPKVYPTAVTFCFWYSSIKIEVIYVDQQSGAHAITNLTFAVPSNSYLAYMLKNSANNEVSFTNDYDAFAICGQTANYFSMTPPSYYAM